MVQTRSGRRQFWVRAQTLGRVFFSMSNCMCVAQCAYILVVQRGFIFMSCYPAPPTQGAPQTQLMIPAGECIWLVIVWGHGGGKGCLGQGPGHLLEQGRGSFECEHTMGIPPRCPVGQGRASLSVAPIFGGALLGPRSPKLT